MGSSPWRIPTAFPTWCCRSRPRHPAYPRPILAAESVSWAGDAADAFTLAAVPALWRAWHDAQAIPASVRLAISAGAPLPVALEQAVSTARGLEIDNFYGSSECGGIADDATETPRSDGTCAGTPMRGVELNCDDDGCLEVRSPAEAWATGRKQIARWGTAAFARSDLADLKDGWFEPRAAAGAI